MRKCSKGRSVRHFCFCGEVPAAEVNPAFWSGWSPNETWIDNFAFFFWPSTLLPGIVCACALQFFFLGCLWLWLGIASDRFFTENSCEIIRRISKEITTNFYIKYNSYLNLTFIFIIIIIILLLIYNIIIIIIIDIIIINNSIIIIITNNQ